LVIASSCCVVCSRIAPSSVPDVAGTDRFWPKRRAKPRVAKRYASPKARAAPGF
jgi:hypothetical protein